MPDEKFDSHFNDPLADIVFRSRTGTHFRISSWYLARHSTFFADLRKIAQRTETEAIGLALPDKSMRDLLHCFHSPTRTSAFKSLEIPNMEDQFELLAFFDKYDFSHGHTSLCRSMIHCKPADAWEYFRLASCKNNEKFAKRLLGKHLTDIRNSFSLDLLETIPYEWRLPLLYVLAQDMIRWRTLKSTPIEEFLPQLAIAKAMVKRDEKGYPIRVPGEEDEEQRDEEENGEEEIGEEEEEGEKRDEGREHGEGAVGEQT
ncbi:hypothetical protein DB88DRAFT_480894 [Papiliotrema laurentii]|uniref:BTB domain-containing protein n=1 Tax=Papiliotrema laurentii TaxID=5418 RepID=A0AAD9L853_PAPLA|nr:hypothetical protein DB88DRAFT_480894 [Papiliotrema laurentii]